MIGRHISVANGFLKTPEKVKNMDAVIFQFFSASPRTMSFKMRPVDVLEEFGQCLKENGVKSVIHGNYTVNLANEYSTFKGKKSVDNAIKEMTTAYHIGKECIGVIYHVGKNVDGQKNPIDIFADNINTVLDKSPGNTHLIIETSAGRGTDICVSIEELAELYSKVKKKRRMHFCIDTCHIWAAGYNIGTKKGVEEYMDSFDSLIGLKKVKCIHFNDSKDTCGSKKDNHQNIGKGKIPLRGLKRMAQIAAENGIYIVMETPIGSGTEASVFKRESKLVIEMIE